MTTPLTKQTPVQIDTEIAAIQEIEGRAVYRLQSAYSALERGKKTTLDLQTKFPAEYGPDWKFYEQENAEKEIADQTRIRDAARAKAAPLHAEFARRGGWSRFFVVLNDNGHCHSSTACSTCFPTTRFGWVTTLSGSTEEEAVKEYGSKMCTVCFPSAPVSKFWGEGRIAREEREEKEARQAERQAKRNAKEAAQVTGENGRILYKTERGAELDIVSNFESAESFEEHAERSKNEPGEYDRLMGHARHYRAEVEPGIIALALKRNISPDSLRKALADKAKAQYIKKSKQAERQYGRRPS